MIRPTVLLLAMSVIFFGFLSTVMSAAIPSADVTALGLRFQELREIKGHFDGGAFDAAVDGPDGEKRHVMVKLADSLAKPGVLSKDITAVMGPSDSIPAEILKTLKRTEPLITPPTNFGYILYKWRGYHDYLWIRINLKTKTVSKAEWYYAYE